MWNFNGKYACTMKTIGRVSKPHCIDLFKLFFKYNTNKTHMVRGGNDYYELHSYLVCMDFAFVCCSYKYLRCFFWRCSAEIYVFGTTYNFGSLLCKSNAWAMKQSSFGWHLSSLSVCVLYHTWIRCSEIVNFIIFSELGKNARNFEKSVTSIQAFALLLELNMKIYIYHIYNFPPNLQFRCTAKRFRYTFYEEMVTQR